MSLHHSVRLDEQLCRGCTNCLKTCSTEAIPVKKGKAYIIEERRIDCGACIRRCLFRAKKAYSDSLAAINGYDFTIALPAPALYGQFPRVTSADNVLEGLVSLGFDECVEVAYAAEAVSRATRAYRNVHSDEGPITSSSCAAKFTATRDSLGDPDSSSDGVIGFNEIRLPLQETVSRIVKEANGGIFSPPRSEAGFRGVSWARAEGEAEGAGLVESLAADGIGAVVEVLEALEDDRLEDIGFLELMACVGGPLTVENPYLARARIRAIEEEGREGELRSVGASNSGIPVETDWRYDAATEDVNLGLSTEIEPMPVFSLDDDYEKAVRMMGEMDVLTERLPGLDCGSCSSPSCRSPAEDIVRGYARETDCVFRLRDRIWNLTEEMPKLEDIVSPGMDKK